MTTQAGAELPGVEIVELPMADLTVTTDKQHVYILKSTLDRLAAPAQDREAIAAIIEPGIFAHDGSGSMVEFMGQHRREEAMKKADAIIALNVAAGLRKC